MNVVFDFGAVLFTWQPGKLLLKAFPERAATKQDAAKLSHQMFGHSDWHDFDRGVLAMEAVIARTANRLDLPADAMADLVRGIGEQLAPIQETVALLHLLHTRRQAGECVTGLYYLSNMPEPYARFLEAQHGFLRCFDGGIFSGDVHHIKPQSEIYALLECRYALQPAQTVFIDDLAHNVEAAVARGWLGIKFESAAQVQAQLWPMLAPTVSLMLPLST